ncbi:MAG: tripartite tricarboxylate transporter permease [Candidatus Erginobacter occultus]|nr:tripartite tricarboxylate transporter permease [Candidatus Erginobacter occultus]
MEISSIVIATLLGTALGGLLFCIPGVGAVGIAAILLTRFGSAPWLLSDPELLLVFFAALAVSNAFASIIPAFFFGAPQPSTIFLVVPGERCRREGRSLRSALDAGRGCLAGIILLAGLSPFFLYLFAPLQGLIFSHFRWAAALLVLYMLGSEAVGHLRREDYQALWMAPLIFILAGFFGVLLLHSRLFPRFIGGGTLYAALIGLFLIPPLVRRMLEPIGEPPKQETGGKLPRERRPPLLGIAAGGIGGLLAFLFPGISAGPGALVAGHLIPRKRERAFLFSQGMVQSLVSAGAFLLFFLPERAFIRSGLARAISPYHHSSRHLNSFILIVAVILIAGGLSYLLFHLTARLGRSLSREVSPRVLSAAIIFFVLGLVCFRYGPAQLPVLLTWACIGSLPLVFGCRRSNLFAYTLLPYLIYLPGWHVPLAAFLGLR